MQCLVSLCIIKQRTINTSANTLFASSASSKSHWQYQVCLKAYRMSLLFKQITCWGTTVTPVKMQCNVNAPSYAYRDRRRSTCRVPQNRSAVKMHSSICTSSVEEQNVTSAICKNGASPERSPVHGDPTTRTRRSTLLLLRSHPRHNRLRHRHLRCSRPRRSPPPAAECCRCSHLG